MKIIVLGKRLSGKTPFCIEAAAALEWQHIEALNWLRSHFETGDFAMMIHDPTWMDHIVQAELASNPNACSDYVKAKLKAGRTALVDGLFTLPDFTSVFDPSKDHIVRLSQVGNKVTPTSYERHLEDIEQHIETILTTGTLKRSRLHNYEFHLFRRGNSPQSTARDDDKITCTSLEEAIADFINQMWTVDER